MVPSRPKDVFGASVIYARFSDSIRGFDQDQINFGTLFTPSIWHPSGTGIRYPDAQVTGIRSVVKF